MTTIKPLGDRVLIEQVEAIEETQGGIIIPDSAKEKPQEYKVVALGTGGKDKDGNDIAFEVAVDDIVLTSQYGGSNIKMGNKEYKIVAASDILAVFAG